MQPNDTTPDSTVASAPAAADASIPDTAPAAPETTPEPTESIDDALSKAFRRANTVRDEGGRFAPKDGADPAKAASQPEKAETAPGKPAEPAIAADKSAETVEAKPAVEAPRAWTAEQKAQWAKLPPETQGYIAQREAELQEAKSSLGRFAPVADVLNQYGDYLRNVGMPAPQYLNQLLAASQALDRDPGGTIKQLAKMYGVDLGQIWDPNEQPPDPRVAALERENNALKAQWEARAAESTAAREQDFVRTVTEFLDSTPDARGLENDIAIEIAAIRQVQPDLAPAAVLKEAYERAAWQNPKTRETRVKAQIEAAVKAAEQARIAAAEKAAEAAQKARSVNVNGATRPVTSNPDDIDSTLRATYRRMAAR